MARFTTGASLGHSDLHSVPKKRLDPPAVNKPSASPPSPQGMAFPQSDWTMHLPIPVDLDSMKQIGHDDEVIEDAWKRSFEIGVMKRG